MIDKHGEYYANGIDKEGNKFNTGFVGTPQEFLDHLFSENIRLQQYCKKLSEENFKFISILEKITYLTDEL